MAEKKETKIEVTEENEMDLITGCLLYTSDAADE